MELNELKSKWNEIDSRLSNIETTNQNAIHELTSMRTKSSINEFKKNCWYGAFALMFVGSIMVYFFGHDEEIMSIMNPYSIKAIIGFLVVACMYEFYRAIRASKLDLTMPTAELMVKANKMRRFVTIESMCNYFVIVALYIIIFFFERSWIIERGRVLQGILLLIALITLASFAFVLRKRRNQKVLDDIASNLKELSDME